MDLMITEHDNNDNLVLRGDGIKDSKGIAGTYGQTSLFAETTCPDYTQSPKRMRISEIMELAPTGYENLVIGGNSENIEQTNSDKSSTTDALSSPLAAAISSEKKEPVCMLRGPGCKDGVSIKLKMWHEFLRNYIPHRKIGTDGLGTLPFTSEEFKQITGDFSDKNFLGCTQFEMLYRGNLTDDDGEFHVVVKICNLIADRRCTNIVWISRIIDEIKFLQDPIMKVHPNLVRIIGYCEEGKNIGVVYALDPLDTLHNLILKGSLNLDQTFSIALGLAQLLDFFHSKDYLLCNLTPSHIIIDKYFVPRLVDFMLLTGGIMGNRMGMEGNYNFGTRGYKAPEDCHSRESDVYVYGVILINLIAKKSFAKNASVPFWADTWARKEYKKPEVCSLVHESLTIEMDGDIGENITKLAIHCLERQKEKRPTMKQVVASLQVIMLSHIVARRRRLYKKASGSHF